MQSGKEGNQGDLWVLLKYNIYLIVRDLEEYILACILHSQKRQYSMRGLLAS